MRKLLKPLINGDLIVEFEFLGVPNVPVVNFEKIADRVCIRFQIKEREKYILGVSNDLSYWQETG